jgi:dihydrofolate reductase
MEYSRKIILYICHSMDGYIAEEDGGLNWLEKIDTQGSDCGYADFLNSIDTALIGKSTMSKW